MAAGSAVGSLLGLITSAGAGFPVGAMVRISVGAIVGSSVAVAGSGVGEGIAVFVGAGVALGIGVSVASGVLVGFGVSVGASVGVFVATIPTAWPVFRTAASPNEHTQHRTKSPMPSDAALPVKDRRPRISGIHQVKSALRRAVIC